MSTENLIQALRGVLEAEQAERGARERYEGCDWGYHGHYYAEDIRKAYEVFQSALDGAIDARVHAVLREEFKNRASTDNP